MNLPSFLVSFLASKWARLAVAAVGFVAGLDRFVPFLPPGVFSNDVKLATVEATLVLSYLTSSGLISVSQRHVDTRTVPGTVVQTALKALGVLCVVLSTVLFVVYVAACAQVQSALTAVQDACQAEVLVTSVIPPGTPVQVVANDVAIGCNVEAVLEPYLEKVVAAWIAAHPTDATAYIPSPRVAARRSIRVLP